MTSPGLEGPSRPLSWAVDERLDRHPQQKGRGWGGCPKEGPGSSLSLPQGRSEPAQPARGGQELQLGRSEAWEMLGLGCLPAPLGGQRTPMVMALFPSVYLDRESERPPS